MVCVRERVNSTQELETRQDEDAPLDVTYSKNENKYVQDIFNKYLNGQSYKEH